MYTGVKELIINGISVKGPSEKRTAMMPQEDYFHNTQSLCSGVTGPNVFFIQRLHYNTGVKELIF